MKIFLKMFLCLLLMAPFVSINTIHADNQKELQKQVNKKASKIARKEAKQFKKDGWRVTPGSLPLEKQFDNSYLKQFETTEKGEPLYIIGEAMSVGANYDAAKLQAIELAKQNIAGQIQTEITALIENTVANEQLGKGEAESITQTVAASKNLISNSLGRTVPIVECYRDMTNGNKEVLVRLAYDQEQVQQQARKIIKKKLEEKGDSLHNQLDQLLGWDSL